MAKVLFTWEFGGGLGHLRRFLPIAEELYHAGHQITIAAPSTGLVKDEFTRLREQGLKYQLIQGLTLRPPSNPDIRKIPTHSFADVLRLFGYYNSPRLIRYIGKWRELCERVDPDLIVSDFSPSVALAVRDRVKRIVVGNGYTIPPGGNLLPPIRPWTKTLQPYSRANEGEALTAINRVAQKYKDPAIDYFGDIFSGHHTFVCSIKEFDPYGDHRPTENLFPFNIDIPDAGGPIKDRTGADIVVYLPGRHTQMQEILTAISNGGRSCEAYISNRKEQTADWAGKNITLHDRPLDLKAKLPTAKLVIHHAGLGTALAGALAGTPQYLFSQNLEHFITAHGLITFGCGERLTRVQDAVVDDIEQMIETLIGDEKYTNAAAETATILGQRAKEDSLGKIVAATLAALQ